MKLLLVLFIVFTFITGWACTIGVVNGSATDDGRPFFWKSRGAGANVQVFHEDIYDYEYVGSGNTGSEYSWMGVNEAGLAIANAMVGDLERLPGNGDCMLQALRECETVAEFLVFLDSTNVTGRETHTCYVILDATGAAMMLEVGTTNYWVYDTADTEYGFIVRTSFTIAGGGTPDTPYLMMNSIMTELAEQGPLNWQDIFPYIMRDFYDENFDLIPLPFTHRWDINHAYGYVSPGYSNNVVGFTSAALVQGVLAGEPPWLSTMWTILGTPTCGIATPFWPTCPSIPAPAVGNPLVPLTNRATQVRLMINNASPYSWADSFILSNEEGTGYWDTILPFEEEKFELIDNLRDVWVNNPPTINELQSYQTSICNDAYDLVMGWDLSTDVTADFDCNESLGEIPFTAHFNDKSLHAPDSLAWDFNCDGVIDSVMTEYLGMGANWTYEEEGSYSVKLIAYRDTLLDSLIIADYITAFDPHMDYLSASVDTVICDFEEPYEEEVFLYNNGYYPVTISEYFLSELPEYPDPYPELFWCEFSEPEGQLPQTINPGDSLLMIVYPMMPVREYWGEILHLIADRDTLLIPCLYDENLWQDADENGVPVQETMLSNYPNPFNPQTTLFWQSADAESCMEIRIYNVRGQIVKTFADLPASGKLVWKGTNEAGNPVSSGIYYSRLYNGDISEATQKLILLK
ncbi:MAG: T9SS type A sorting domain-containing protein [Candidatus Cloacimonetes bacterium]|nr:T9SS type A sorting domain-containing protein [Candidatus Cloacimonadota bacterium]